ncbi:hypothetical protein WISP_53548 [Willisornis vidua]|uniref:EGF-like domain-containing protein n=1 Tax=Willisornis vidua TaxID=1566151 RepID=A0ABQ9DCR0_9PASS|nr:hypothetical protein WISP_53548 [Willisornis vidua]
MVVENASGRQCVRTACAERPCHYGTCTARSPSAFQCHCPDGYSGHRCEVTLAIFHKDTGLSFSSLFAICVCFLALLALLSAAFLWAHWRTRKGLHGGVYHGSAHPEDLEDIRENILNYNEEGGGEQDEDAYNMAELQVSVQASPAYSLCKRKGTPTQQKGLLGTQGQPRAAAAAGATFPSADFGQYLSGVLREADWHGLAGPRDSLRVFCTEGAGSRAGSLSSLSSAGLEEGTVYDDIKEWGPKFEKLSELYSQRDAGDL